MSEPQWLLQEAVLAIHQRQIAEHGGAPTRQVTGLPESTLVVLQHKWADADPAPDLPALAAAYAFGISRNHPFVDGNKRTGYVACRTFLLINGSDFTAAPEEAYVTFLSLAEGTVSEAELAAWIRERSHPAS